jgi:8-oxo-dGTP pyrophosphatase MutT (NUDIX family)
MTPAPGAGGEAKRKRRHAKKASPHSSQNNQNQQNNQKQKNKPSKPSKPSKPYAKRVDEVSAGGLVIDKSGTKGLLIGRKDLKDQTGQRLLWSLPKGHIEEGETPEQAAIREVAEETGIQSEISKALGVIDFWFMAGGKRIHKTVHHFLFKEVGGVLAPQESEVDDVGWFPLNEVIGLLAYPDEKKLIAKSGDLPT